MCSSHRIALAAGLLAASATAAAALDERPRFGRVLSPYMLRNAGAAEEAFAIQQERQAKQRGGSERVSAPLYPPFSPAPQLTITDINGSSVTFPQPGVPTVVFAYNASDPTTEAAWSDQRGSLNMFMQESLLPTGSANATRYVFLSFSTSAPATDAALMRSKLVATMAGLNWPANNQTDWLSRATFGKDSVSSLGGGWVADLLSNWTNVGSTLSLSVGEEDADTLTVSRVDAHFGWLPSPPLPGAAATAVSFATTYGGDALTLRGRMDDGQALPRGTALLLTCGFELKEAAAPAPAAAARALSALPCNFTAALSAAASAGAASVILIQSPGSPLVEMDCSGEDECALDIGIPASMVRHSDGLALWRKLGRPAPLQRGAGVSATLEFTAAAASSGITFSISAGGLLYEVGWLRSSLRFLSWAGQWLDFERRTQANLTLAAPGAVTLSADGRLHSWGDASFPGPGTAPGELAARRDISGPNDANTVIVPVFNYSLMHGFPGAQATVTIPDAVTLGGLVSPAAAGPYNWTGLTLDLALSCATPWDTGCPPWDRQMQVRICCTGNQSDPTCGGQNIEIGRYITPFRRGLGRWLTDVSPLLPLVASSSSPQQCTLTVSTDAWAQPWYTSLSLRLERSTPAPSSPAPGLVVPLWSSGGNDTEHGGQGWGVAFDKNYNPSFPVRTLSAPAWATKAVIHSVITGHGADNNNCAEFCVTSHALTVAGTVHSETFDNAGTEEGCTFQTINGALPNEHGTWLYGRDGWCDGSAVRPWVVDVTADVLPHRDSFTVGYRGTFEGNDPNPQPGAPTPAYQIVHIYMVYY